MKEIVNHSIRVYGPFGNLDYKEGFCAAVVYYGPRRRLRHQCSRHNGYGFDRLYCMQHARLRHPARVARAEGRRQRMDLKTQVGIVMSKLHDITECVEDLERELAEEEVKDMTKQEARQLAAQAWCTPETSTIEMDARLAEAFARILLKEIQRDRKVRRMTTTNEGK